MNFNGKSLSSQLLLEIVVSKAVDCRAMLQCVSCYELMVCWAAGSVFGCVLIIKRDKQPPFLGRIDTPIEINAVESQR